MTKIPFTNSLALANEFAVKLLSGFLNMRTDYNTDGSPLVEVSHTTNYFTTERMAQLRVMLSDFRLSRLEVTDPQTDPDSQWPASELRHTTVFAREREGREILIAVFDVHRDYVDGDNAEGWTRWQVKNVGVFLDDIGTEIVPKYLKRDDREPIWGTRV